MLINSHKPAWNKVHVGFLTERANKQVMRVQVLNCGNYGSLLPEVSGMRWSSKYDYVDNYGPCGSHCLIGILTSRWSGLGNRASLRKT